MHRAAGHALALTTCHTYDLQVMRELGQPASAASAARSAHLSQLIASMSTLLARDLRLGPGGRGVEV